MNTDVPQYETGVIHGRFQVLHNDHLRYLLAGKQLCEHLVVGITNPDPFMTRKESADPTRDDPLANPLTYYERYVLVRTVLEEAGLRGDQFSVVPLPINLPDRYQYYVPLDAVFFLTIYDDWGRRKSDYFRSLGILTHVLWEVPHDQKGISAGEIRHRIIDDAPWEHMVPPGVPGLIRHWNIPARLKEIRNRS